MKQSLIQVQIDETEILGIAKQKIQEYIQQVDAEMVFWDANELKKRTCMSWPFIQETFFFCPDFPKRKIGAKWYFPARETRLFLERWLDRQPK